MEFPTTAGVSTFPLLSGELPQLHPEPPPQTLCPHLGKATHSCMTSKRGGRWYMLEFLYMRGFGAWSALIKTDNQPSAEHPSAVLMAQSHLPFARDHLNLVFAAVRGQPANVVCDFGYTNKDLRSHLFEKSSCSQAYESVVQCSNQIHVLGKPPSDKTSKSTALTEQKN